MSHTSIVIKDKEIYTKFKQIMMGQGKDVSSFLWEYIITIVSKYDDGETTLDKFMDPNYVFMPEIMDPDEKWVSWFKVQNDQMLYELTSKLYRLRVYCRALEQTPKHQRLNFNYNYEYVWNRYG